MVSAIKHLIEKLRVYFGKRDNSDDLQATINNHQSPIGSQIVNQIANQTNIYQTSNKITETKPALKEPENEGGQYHFFTTLAGVWYRNF